MADNKFLTNFNNLQEQIYQRLNPNPQSASALKDTLARAMRPGTDRQLGTIKKNLASTKAGIDVDSSTRGVGGSSYNTDAKLRAEQMAAQNAADVEGNYQANLYNALLSRLNAQDELAMSARNNAFGLAQGLYGSVYPNETGGGGGGWGRRGGSSGGDGGGNGTYQDALNELKKQGYTTRSAVDYLQKGTNPQKVQKSQPKKKVTNGGVGINYLAAR